ncbi:hypothetical protein AB1N83_014231 [Pleurotus pulmonarius]
MEGCDWYTTSSYQRISYHISMPVPSVLSVLNTRRPAPPLTVHNPRALRPVAPSHLPFKALLHIYVLDHLRLPTLFAPAPSPSPSPALRLAPCRTVLRRPCSCNAHHEAVCDTKSPKNPPARARDVPRRS